MKNPYIHIPKGKFNTLKKCYICHGTCVDICPWCCGRKTFLGEKCSECNGVGTVSCYACGGRGVVDE